VPLHCNRDTLQHPATPCKLADATHCNTLVLCNFATRQRNKQKHTEAEIDTAGGKLGLGKTRMEKGGGERQGVGVGGGGGGENEEFF